MNSTEWLLKAYPNKGNNEHSTYSVQDMKEAYYAGTMHGATTEEQKENTEPTTEESSAVQKKHSAKNTSLIAQIIAALWVAFWCGKKFFVDGGDTNDIIFSGFAIAACFSPVYFNMILDKIKNIRFGNE